MKILLSRLKARLADKDIKAVKTESDRVKLYFDLNQYNDSFIYLTRSDIKELADYFSISGS